MLKFLIGTYRRRSFFWAEKIFQVELMAAYGLVSVEPSLGLGSQASLVTVAPLGKQRRSIHLSLEGCCGAAIDSRNSPILVLLAVAE